MPRIRMTSVGYAFRAQWSDTANYARSGGGGSGSPWVFRVTDGSDTTITTGGRWGIARYGNVLLGNADSTHVNLGVACTTGTSGQNYKYCTVGGGVVNTASGDCATVGGGDKNTAGESKATVGGGYSNSASGGAATIGGGWNNTASVSYATVGGGHYNTVNGYAATVSGGENNRARGNWSVVAGGGGIVEADSNAALGDYSVVPGGNRNSASGDYSFAAGRRAKANHTGAFVWADGTNDDFASTGHNQFLIRASGGVGIGTNDPDERLHVEDATGNNAIKVRSASACTSSLKLFEGSDYGFELAYCGNDDKLHLWSRKFSGNEDIRMTWLKNGNVGIGTTTPGTKLAVSGLTGTASYNNVRINTATGDFYYYSSSRRYKDDIRPLEDDFRKILQVESKSFVDKASGQREIGYIAEEFDGMGLNNLVIYDKEHQPDGLKYELVSLYLLEVMKEQEEAIRELKAINEELRQRIETLEGR